MVDTLLIDILSFNETDLSFSTEISGLLKLAFKERLDSGLNFTCALFSPEDVIDNFTDKTVFIARDSDLLVGIMTLSNKNGKGHMEFVAVHPDYKGCGVATKLFYSLENHSKSCGLKYITSTTACKADSSVRWHKKMGFHIYGLGSDSQTNYYSYLFNKPLDDKSKWNNPFYVKITFMLYYIAIHIGKKRNGEPTFTGKYLMKIKRLFEKI